MTEKRPLPGDPLASSPDDEHLATPRATSTAVAVTTVVVGDPGDAHASPPVPADVRHVVVPSPLGELTLVAEGDALVGLYVPDQAHRPADARLGAPGDPHAEPFEQAARELGEYFDGVRETFGIPVRLRGTAFQLAVWSALAALPPGETITYGGIAELVGRRAAGRAVGAAVGRNPVSVVIPCHRVVGADGALTGYAGGMERKVWLLRHEHVLAPDALGDDMGGEETEDDDAGGEDTAPAGAAAQAL